MKPVLVLDRDGVLNKLIYDRPIGRAPRAIFELEYLAPKRYIQRLQDKFSVVCITNQPDISNGAVTQQTAIQMHAIIMAYFEIENSFMCIHNNENKCLCRKPGTQMLEMAEQAFGSSKQVTIVGDRWTDIFAGNKLGWRTVLLDQDSHSMDDNSQGSPPQNLLINERATSWSELLDTLLKETHK